MPRTLTAMVAATTIVAATALPAMAVEPDGPSPSAISWEGPFRSDTIGDAGPGRPDIDQYQMSYDSATDQLVVEARILTVPAGEWGFSVQIDLDRDRSTGCNGSDRLVRVDMEGPNVIGQRTTPVPDCASGAIPVAMPVTASFTPMFGYMVLPIARTLLGSPVSLDWWAATSDPTMRDRAPDSPELAEEFGWVRPFADVRTDAFYSGPIAWLRQSGLSTGIGTTGNYDPDGPVTRAQMATFIWRIAGEPFDPPAPLIDIERPSFYADAVDWLYDAGLTTGVGGSNRFAPHDPVTRGQMVTFLWRYAGEPAGYPAPGFDDVTNPAAYYYDAIAFAKAEGITTGIGGTNQFRPDDVVTRGQLATFLQRYFAPLGTPTFVP